MNRETMKAFLLGGTYQWVTSGYSQNKQNRGVVLLRFPYTRREIPCIPCLSNQIIQNLVARFANYT